MAAVTAGLRLAEQVLFVFVASLWPNAVGGVGGAGVGDAPEILERFEFPAPAAGQRVRRGVVDDGGDGEESDEEGEDRREGERRREVVV